MIESMYIGSGDIPALLAGINTKTHLLLLQRFVSGVKPYYNALASPIDALRTGAILEERMLLFMPDNYLSQYRVECSQLNVFRSTLDFACLKNGSVCHFFEMKTVFWLEFAEMREAFAKDNIIEYIKKKRKNEYVQIQAQLMCTNLEKATFRYVIVYNYDDEENWQREITERDYLDIEINRDDVVISKIVERGKIFQQIKDEYDR